MERIARLYAIPAGLMVIKLLVTLQTAIDTYAVSNSPLKVLVIDGVFLIFWLIAAYAGSSQKAMAVRPFAAGGAWLMYALMLYIAWEAGQMHGEVGAVGVSLIARVAGAVLLLYDTYDYVAALVQKRASERSGTWRDSVRSAVNALAYLLVAVLIAPLFVAVLQVLRVARDYWSDGRDPDAPVRTQTKVSIHVERITEPNPSLDAHLNTVVAQLTPGQTFRRPQVEQWTGLKKVHAITIINHAKSSGIVRDVRRGVYVYDGVSTIND